MTQKRTLSMLTTVRIVYEFLSNDDVPSRIRGDLFRTSTFYEKLLLHSKHFCRAAIFPESLVEHNSYFFGAATSSEHLFFWSSYFFRTLTSSQQLFFRAASFSDQLLFRESAKLRALRALRCSYTSRVLCLACSLAGLDSSCSFAPRPSLALGVSSECISCLASHASCLVCFCCFSYLNF